MLRICARRWAVRVVQRTPLVPLRWTALSVRWASAATVSHPTTSHSLPSETVSHASTSQPRPAITLRPYQERAVSECLSAIASGTTRIGVSAPTGSGKTTMFTELIGRLPAIEGATRVLIIVNSIELALQAAGAVTRAYPNLLVEIEQGAKFKATGVADVTIATYQTLTRASTASGAERLDKFNPRGFKGIIVDEAHHAASKSYIHLLSRFDPAVGVPKEERGEVKPDAPRVPIIGFSATFSRHDGLALGRIFDRIVYHRDFLEMIDEQWLCPIKFTAIKTDLDLTAVRVSSTSGDFLARSLSSYTNTPVINRLIVRSWLEKARQRRSTLVFATDVQHTMDLTVEYREAGVDARYLHGGTPLKERKQLLADFKSGVYPVLINCAILTEGFDLPQIDCVLLARPTRSKNLFSQMIGRGLRLSPDSGKVDCLVLDLVGSLQRGVVCTPTLFGLDPSQAHDIENATLDDLKERLANTTPQEDNTDPLSSLTHADPTKVTFINYDSPRELQEALINRNSHEVIARLSPFAWVHCGGSVFILEIPRQGFIRVEPTSDSTSEQRRWNATFTRQNADFEESAAATGNERRYVPYRRPLAILSGGDDGESPIDLATTVRLCDTYATSTVLRCSPMNPLLRRDAAWRQAPATPSQCKLVSKRIKGKSGEEVQEAEGLTKGQAAEILTRLKFGFKRRWESEVRAWNKVARGKEKERERVEREIVRVGDL